MCAENEYLELQELADEARKAYEGYKEDCNNFVGKLREELVKELQCPAGYVKRAKLEDSLIQKYRDQGNVVEDNVFGIFFADKNYLIIIGFDFGPHNQIPSNVVFYPLRIKKDQNGYKVKIENTIHEVSLDLGDQLIHLAQYIIQDLKMFLETGIEGYFHVKEKKKLGFLLS